MMLTSQKGAGLIMAMMLAHGAPAEAPAGNRPEVAEQAPPMMIAAGETSAGGEEGAFRRLSEGEKERARNLLDGDD